MRLNAPVHNNRNIYPNTGTFAHPMEQFATNSRPPSSILSNSTSWSGPLGHTDMLLRPGPDQQHQQFEQARQTRRSWARSKRISLGCLEWRANSTISGRAPRPKSANHRLDIPSIGELPCPNLNKCGSHSSVYTHALSERTVPGIVLESSKSSHGSQRTKATGGADALLRRLRMKPLGKGARAKTPTPVGGEIAGRLASVPIRSSSTPRNSCMSKSFIEWTATETCVFPSCSHGSRLNMTAEESIFPVVSAAQRTESYPTVGPCSNPALCPCMGQLPIQMTRSFIPYSSACSLGLNPTYTGNGNLNGNFTMAHPAPCSASCCQPIRPTTTNGYLAAPNELYRPQSQPSCYFFSHVNNGATDSEELMNSNPTTNFSTLPWPPTRTTTLDTQVRNGKSPSAVPSSPNPAYLATFWSGNGSQTPGVSANQAPGSMLASFPSVSRYGQFAFPSSRTTEALFVSCGDSNVRNHPPWPAVPPHMTASSTPLKPGHIQGYNQPPGIMHSPRARSTEQSRDDASLLWSSTTPHVPSATGTYPQRTVTTSTTSTTTVPPSQTRPDSLLSTSSLTTADSSQTDSLPNSSSSRDSALGGNAQQTEPRGLARNKLTELNANTVQTHQSAHQPHPSHPHHHHHHHPHQSLIQDARSWHAEELHRTNRSSNEPNQRYQPQPPPRPTAVVEPRLPPTPTRSVAWPPRLTSLPNFAGSQPNWPSQKARAERKHSVYVNAAIYPLREQPQTQTGADRSPTVMGTTAAHGNGSARRSPPATWTHLLPYRMSTVPQNLSERLKKSETLPNDVWVHAQRPDSSNDQHSQNNSSTSSTKEQVIRQNGTDGIHVGLKSPPPRPPVRTSSQQFVGRASSSESRVPRPNPVPIPPSRSMQQKQSNETSLSGLLTSDQTTLEDSPILCRYSQLYSLALKPESTEQSKLTSKSSLGHSDSPVLPRPVNGAASLPPETLMQNLRIRTEDMG